jgi:hypothetical protein
MWAVAGRFARIDPGSSRSGRQAELPGQAEHRRVTGVMQLQRCRLAHQRLDVRGKRGQADAAGDKDMRSRARRQRQPALRRSQLERGTDRGIVEQAMCAAGTRAFLAAHHKFITVARVRGAGQ